MSLMMKTYAYEARHNQQAGNSLFRKCLVLSHSSPVLVTIHLCDNQNALALTRHASLPHPVLSLTETKMLLHFFQEADRQGQDGYAQCAVLLWWQCLAAWGKQIEQLRLLSSIPVGRRVHIRTHKEKDRQPLSVGMQQSTSSLGASWGTHTISSLQISHLINKCHPPAVTFLQTTYSMPFKILLYFT